MPKRDEAYMAGQRQAIARAALKVLLRKGVRETTLRDICREAGISVGALYIHFRTKEEATAAACQLDYHDVDSAPLPQTWQQYLDAYSYPEVKRNSRAAKRLRLSLQFAAELSQLDRNPDGLTHLYARYRQRIVATLALFQDRGEIAPPLGLERTADVHLQLIFGALYQIACNRDLPVRQVHATLHAALAMTAGCTATSAGTERRPSAVTTLAGAGHARRAATPSRRVG